MGGKDHYEVDRAAGDAFSEVYPGIVKEATQSRQFLIRTVRFLDVHDPDLIISDARNVLNLSQPIAVMLMGILGHVADFDEMRSIVARVMAAVPSGSYLALYDGTDVGDAYVEAIAKYAESGAVPYNLRSPEQIGRCFDGLEMVEPGLVPISQWRPDTAEVGEIEPVEHYGAVARKP